VIAGEARRRVSDVSTAWTIAGETVIRRVATTVKIDQRTRHRLIALSSVRGIGKDRKLSLSRHRGSARIADKLTSEPPDDQARELAPIESQATGTVPLATGRGGYNHVAAHRP
jgi:hypothetical protein